SLLLRASPHSPLFPYTTLFRSVPVVLERVNRTTAGQIWLFSRDTLDAVGPLYADVTSHDARVWLPGFLFEWHVGSVRLFEWVAIDRKSTRLNSSHRTISYAVFC